MQYLRSFSQNPRGNSGSLIFTAILLIAAFAGGFYIGRRQVRVSEPLPQSTTASSTVRILIDSGTVITSVENVPWSGGQTVYDALVYAKEHRGLELSVTDYGKDRGLFIDSIDGAPTSKTALWQVRVNGVRILSSPSSYAVKPNDLIELKLSGATEKNI
jgi:hypothetical protein